MTDSGTHLTDVPFEELLATVLCAEGRYAELFREHVTRLGGVMQEGLLRAAMDRARRGVPGEEDEMWQCVAELYRRLVSRLDRRPAPAPLTEPATATAGAGAAEAAAAQAARQADPAVGTVTGRAVPPGDDGAVAGAPATGGGTPHRPDVDGWAVPGARPVAPEVREAGEQVRRAIEQVFVEFADEAEVRRWTGGRPVPAGFELVDRWRAFHLSLLRLPPALEALWTARMRSAAPAYWLEPAENWQRVPAPATVPGRVLVPACGRYPGVLADPRASKAGGVAAPLSGNEPGHDLAAGLAHQMSWLAAADEAAHSARTWQLTPLRDPHEGVGYTELLTERLAKFSQAVAWGETERCVLRAAQLAEGLRMVVHRPLVAPDSWWHRLRDETVRFVREVAAEHAPHVVITEIAGRYAEAKNNGLTDGRDDVRLTSASESDGLVLDCLRPHLRGTELGDKPGRVVYGATH
ncbi:hypothetical protein [Micromonospora carbonacea]|uniref:hypothetical protein n=1 Tax=Micromonospora carbonacea TaxID=47853 RepID=UPI003719CDED